MSVLNETDVLREQPSESSEKLLDAPCLSVQSVANRCHRRVILILNCLIVIGVAAIVWGGYLILFEGTSLPECWEAWNRQTGEVLSGPDVISRGFVYEPLSEEFLERAKEEVAGVLAHLSKAQVTEWGSIHTSVRETLSKFIYNELRRRPMVVPIVMEV